MIDRDALTTYCNQLLAIDNYRDYCPNGLQVAGNKAVTHIVSGVSACQDLVDAAVAQQADMLLVHHGYFWKNTSACLTGIQKRRIQTLLQHDISLLAYHLPLDGHAKLGNNAQLAQYLHWHIDGDLPSTCGQAIGKIGRLAQPMQAQALQAQLASTLSHQPLMIANDPEQSVHRIAWCSGAAVDDIHYAIDAGVDAFITGEPAERVFHIARETGIVFYAAGHHATERYGVQALGAHLATQFGITHQYIDIPCPI